MPKIRLSPGESELMQNAETILTKNRVLKGIREGMEALAALQQEAVREWQLEGTPAFGNSPKVTRGENYEGLPWLVLDYPRIPAKEGFFFIRSFFWWGRFFSSTLHLSGVHADGCREALAASFGSLQDAYVGVGRDPWVHDLDRADWAPTGRLTEVEYQRIIREAEHIKIARRFDLQQWEEATRFWRESWESWLRLCDQLPRR